MLTGVPVFTMDEERVGEISETLAMRADGSMERAVIDVGGFLGIGEKPVAVPLEQLDIQREADGDDLRVLVTMPREQIELMPVYKPQG